jgi:type VI secretion system protein ImpL
MKISWGAGAAFAVALAIGIAGASFLHLKGPEFAIFIALLAALGLGAAAAVSYFQSKAERQPDTAPAAAGDGGNSELDVLIREANARLAQSNVSHGAQIAGLPLIFVIGDRGMAKTSTVMNSGLEPELLAGHVFQDNAVAPTRAANVWFARGHVFVEAGGAVLGDPANWSRLVKRLQPGKLKSIGKGTQSPRAVLLCFSLEAFGQPGGAEAITAAARYLQARLGDISQLLGISFPVYILFTKTDRVPFFEDFARTFSNEEATQVFGATVPMRTQATGIYAEEETQRLTNSFNDLFSSLCDKRTIFLPREDDAEKVPGAYEFAREFRKLRGALVQFMVDVCRPSQLRASPFLRGFYFSGVRPILVNEGAAIPQVSREAQQPAEDWGGGATRMFRAGKQAENVQRQAVAEFGTGARKAPQWMFLGHLFNDIVLRDSAAMGASGASVKTSMARRVLLASAAGLCLLYSILLMVSYFNNRSLERDALTAARNIQAGEAAGAGIASQDALVRLETLRQSLAKLTGYEDNGAPLFHRWGLYMGSRMYPEVRKIYYAKFRQLLFGQTQNGMMTFLQRTPPVPAPSDDYGYAYTTLKGYLLTAPEYERTSDKSLQQFLGDLLLVRWGANREQAIGKDRMDLAKKQFDFYSRDLHNGNPYPASPDAGAAIERTRVYLSKFSGADRVYQFLLSEAAKKGSSTNFNQKFPGSSETVMSAHPVAYAFTKEGADFMQKEIRKANYGGEQWVLGNYTGQSASKPEMERGILDIYARDYIGQWRAVLKTSHVNAYASLKDASAKLNTLTGSQAPLLALLWWTSQNTAIDLPGVAQAFKAVHTVEPPSGVQQYVVPANQPYNNSLLKLQGTIDQAANMPGGPDPNAENATRADGLAARQSTRQISASFPVDPDTHMETVVEALMLQPITNAEGLSRGMGAADLNGKGAAFCAAFLPLTHKFPFNPIAQPEVTLDELGSIFRPKDGKLWAFYETSLKPVLQCSAADCTPMPNAPVAVNPAFVRFFSQAARFSRALYGESGTDPNFKYTLRPQKSDIIEEFDLTVNGEGAQLAGGASKAYQWPGNGTRNLKLSFKPLGFGPPGKDGLWSVFRFFADADRTTNAGAGYEFFWTLRTGQGGAPMETANGRPVTYEFNLDTGGAPAVFSKDFLSGLKCVGTVAH